MRSTDDSIDKILRDKLEGFRPEPSDASRRRFLDAATGSISEKETRVKPVINGSRTSLNISSSMLGLLLISLLMAVAVNLSTDSLVTVAGSNSRSRSVTKPTTAVKSEALRAPKSEASKELENKTVAESKEAVEPISAAEPSAAAESLLSVAEPEPVGKSINNTTEPGPISESMDTASDKPEPPLRSRLHQQALFVYYEPEVIKNIIGNDKLMQGFGVGWQKRIFNGRYVIGTGAGLVKSRGYYQYAVQYNEHLGAYHKLDSISFRFNAAEYSMEQTRHTSVQQVYDTGITTEYPKVYRNFTYLQIPLTLGYDFYRSDVFTAGLRFAPVLSVMLSGKAEELRYDSGENRLININRITADRVHTNWQLRAGLSITRNLKHNLYIGIEPQFIYYFNSVYEKAESNTSPYGASVRITLGINY